MGVERRGGNWRARQVPRNQHPEPTELSVRFEAVVGQLERDQAWNRRVRSVRRRHRAAWLGTWALRGLAEIGCWFTGVPAQRCTARPLARPAGDG